MPLTQFSLTVNVGWLLERAIAGFNAAQSQQNVAFSANSLPLATWNTLFAETYVIAAAGTQVVDLRTFTDQVANAIATADKALTLIVLVTGAPADVLNLKPNATNGLVWPFENVGYGINIPGGGLNLFSAGVGATGATIDATHKQLLLTNTGAASLTVTVVAVLSDV